MIHALTIDVEDYHNVIPREWLAVEGPPTPQVVRNTERMLAMFAERGVRATFFVLGEVAERFPGLVAAIAGAGHELGVHGYYHRRVFNLSPDEFREEVSKAKARVEDAAGVRVRGHRAPAFSIVPESSWALDVLAEEGFEYDSSIFPIRGRRYGWPGFRQDIHALTLAGGRQLIEAPMSTVTVLGRRLPVAGGGYLRHFPWWVTQWSVKRIGSTRPAIIYLHPYEIEVTRAPLAWEHLDPPARRRTQRFHTLQLRNRHTMEAKIRKLIARFDFAPLGEVIAAQAPVVGALAGA